MRIVTIFSMTVTLILAAHVTGWPQSGQGIQLKAFAEVEVRTLDAQGRSVVKRVPAEKVIPGTQVIYTIQYHNAGEQPAGQVTITNPIPEHMRYQGQSAFGAGAVITFSIDDGKTFDRPEKLQVVDQAGRSFPARPADYTHIRWVLEQPVAPQATGQVGFRAVLE